MGIERGIRIVADGGSTSVKWGVMRLGLPPQLLRSEPMNPLFTTSAQQLAILGGTFAPHLNPQEVARVAFYGASCGEHQTCASLRASLAEFFPHASIVLDSDMVAAALACWDGAPGLTAIIGTGCNVGFYDGQRMRYYTPSLGYLLGDEGSGAWIGRLALRDWLYGLAPAQLEGQMEAFAHSQHGMPLGLTRPERAQHIVDRIHSEPRPNAFLASFARVVIENREVPYCMHLIGDAMHSFADALCHPARRESGQTEIRAVGSIAWYCRDVFGAACASIGLHLTNVVQHPIERLVEQEG